jgi:hypothetical protein
MEQRVVEAQEALAYLLQSLAHLLFMPVVVAVLVAQFLRQARVEAVLGVLVRQTIKLQTRLLMEQRILVRVLVVARLAVRAL